MIDNVTYTAPLSEGQHRSLSLVAGFIIKQEKGGVQTSVNPFLEFFLFPLVETHFLFSLRFQYLTLPFLPLPRALCQSFNLPPLPNAGLMSMVLSLVFVWVLCICQSSAVLWQLNAPSPDGFNTYPFVSHTHGAAALALWGSPLLVNGSGSKPVPSCGSASSAHGLHPGLLLCRPRDWK